MDELKLDPADIAERLKCLGEALRHPASREGFTLDQIESFYKELLDISAKLGKRRTVPNGSTFRKIRAE